MKTKEFETRVAELGYVTVNNGHQIIVYTKGSSLIARLNLHSKQIEIADWTFGSEERIDLLWLMTIYTMTGVESRDEEKRYRLRLVANLSFYMDEAYLNYNPIKAKYFVSNKFEKDSSTTIFTESEIAQMDITGFEKVEVSE